MIYNQEKVNEEYRYLGTGGEKRASSLFSDAFEYSLICEGIERSIIHKGQCMLRLEEVIKNWRIEKREKRKKKEKIDWNVKRNAY